MRFPSPESTLFLLVPRHAVTHFHAAVRCGAVCLDTGGLRLHLLWLANNLIRSTLDDTASLGKLSADAHEVGIDVTGSLATFVDAPADRQQLFDEV